MSNTTAIVTTNIFEEASRKNLLFDMPRGGQLNVSDLWRLPLESETKNNLNDIAKALFKKVKDSDEPISFVNPTKKVENDDKLRFDIVLHIINTLKAENETRLLARDRAEKKQQLLEVLAERDQADLKAKPREEILAMINAL